MRALLAVGEIQKPHDCLKSREIYTEGSVVWEGMQRELEKLFGGGNYIIQQGFYFTCIAWTCLKRAGGRWTASKFSFPLLM